MEEEAIVRTPARASRPWVHSLSRYWFIDTTALPEMELRDVQGRLRRLTIVEMSLMEPDLSEPTVAHVDEYYENQLYLSAAPDGINVEPAWDAGFSGENTGLADVERGWLYDHEDIPKPPRLEAQPVHRMSFAAAEGHGTSVLGLIAAIDGPAQPGGGVPPGIVGVAPGISTIPGELPTLHTSSRFHAIDDQHDVAGAVMAALGKLKIGDVLLLEVQLVCEMPDSTYRKLPLELFQPYWELIRTVVDSGYVVIEPAGNGASGGKIQVPGVQFGGLGLDAAGGDADLHEYFEGVQDWGNEPLLDGAGRGLMELDKEKTAYQDSGAIMVGACDPSVVTAGGVTGHVAMEHLDPVDTKSWGSNYGSRVDCYAWGSQVVTTSKEHDIDGSQGVPETESYTGTFGGTSAASAIIAGAAVLVQDMLKQFRGEPGSSETLRDLLSNAETGTPYVGSRPIGVMPDLGEILAEIKCDQPVSLCALLRCFIRRIMARLSRIFSRW
jgi:hypothetical protein